jgi:galactosamine-6-phosphate isomerase
MKAGRDLSAAQIQVADSYEEMGRWAEQLIAAELKRRPDLILCASAGGTPTRLYELMAARFRRQPRLFEKMRVLQIDEWGGLASRHPATCESDLRAKLLEPLRVEKARYTGFRSQTKDPESECRRIGEWLDQNGPIDICILGLGLNGHVAMNEPAEALVARAHVARLTRSSLNHPMLKQSKTKPRYGLTIGMRDILCSRTILLLVNGTHKQAPFRRLLQPSITTRFPASFVWLHPQTLILCDRAAAGDYGASPRTQSWKTAGKGR